MRFHVRGVDHLCVCGSSVSSKLPEQVFPDATPRPPHKAIIDRCRRSILGRAIAPATAAFQNMHDAADDAAVVRSLDAPYIRRQMRFDPSPLLVAQPKQVPAHNSDPLPTTNQDRIVRAKKLMSSDPSYFDDFGNRAIGFGFSEFSSTRCVGKAGVLTCRLNPSIGFIIAGHQSMECNFREAGSDITQRYDGAINTRNLAMLVGAVPLFWPWRSP